MSKEFRDAYATAMYLGAQSDNEKEQERMKKEAEAAEKGDKELMKELKASLEDLDRSINNNEDKKSIFFKEIFQAKVRQYKELVDKYKDKSGIKYANTLQKLIDDKWPKASQEYEKARKKVEKSGVANKKENKNKGKEKSRDTKKTQNKVEDVIVDNKDVLKTLSEKCGYTGNNLSEFLTKFLYDEKIFNINDNDIDNKIFATTLIVSGVILMNNMDAYKKINNYLSEQKDTLMNQIADFDKKNKKKDE